MKKNFFFSGDEKVYKFSLAIQKYSKRIVGVGKLDLCFIRYNTLIISLKVRFKG